MMVVSFLCHGFRHQKSSWKRRSLGFFVRFPRNVSILNPVFAHSCRNFTARLTDLVKENSSDWSGPFKSGVMRFFVELRDTVYLIQRPIPVAYIYIYINLAVSFASFAYNERNTVATPSSQNEKKQRDLKPEKITFLPPNKYSLRNGFFIIIQPLRGLPTHDRAPLWVAWNMDKWCYNPYRWPYIWVTGVITPVHGVTNG